MLLHIGGDIGVPLGKLVAVLNLENNAADTGSFISIAQEDGFVTEVCSPPHKSCVVIADQKGYTLYLSPISANTLAVRAETGGLSETISNDKNERSDSLRLRGSQ